MTATFTISESSFVGTATVSGTNMSVSAISSGTIKVGDVLTMAGLTAGTTVLSQSSGSAGSTGVYVISNSASIVSGAAVTGAPSTP